MEVRGNQVDISIGVTAGCAACESGKGCGAGLFARLWRRRPVLLTVEHTLPARPGQSVIVGMADQTYLRLVARLYVLPVLAALGGAVLGHWLGAQVPSGAIPAFVVSDAGAILGAAVLSALALWFFKHLPGSRPADIPVSLVQVVTGPRAIECGRQTGERLS